MIDKYIKFNADSAGFFTSLLCALHCSAVPVLISFGLIGSGSWLHNHTFDWVIIALGIIIASYSLLGDYFKKHRNIIPISIAALGFIFLFIGMVEHHGWMLIFSVAGGLMVAFSHLLNFRYGGMCDVKRAGWVSIKLNQD